MSEYLDRLKQFRLDEESDTQDVDYFDISDENTETWGQAKTREYGSPAFERFVERLPPRDDLEDEVEAWGWKNGPGHVYPRVFYHGTPSRHVSKILREGLKGSSPRTFTLGNEKSRKGIYLTETPGDVIGVFANTLVSDNRNIGKEFSILEVKVPRGVPIAEDPEFGDNEPGSGYWIIFGNIPGKTIKVVSKFIV